MMARSAFSAFAILKVFDLKHRAGKTLNGILWSLQMDVAEMIKILNHKNPDEWKKYNETWIQMTSAANRVNEIAYGLGKKKLVILYGPHGIAKTTLANKVLGKRLIEIEKAWTETDPDQRLIAMPWCTTTDNFGISRFRVPIFKTGGRVSPRKLYKIFYEFRHPHNIVILDDLVFYEGTKDLIHHATDFEQGNEVTWDTSKDIVFDGVTYPNRFIFHGSIIIINNVKKDSLELEKKFSDSFRDRGHEIFFSWDRMDLGIYLDKLFFHGGGGHKFINKPKDDGLGLVMTPKRTLPILIDTRSYFLAHFKDIKSMSFRTLEDLTSDRILYQDDAMFEQMAAQTLRR
jgi:hypothetical protein